MPEKRNALGGLVVTLGGYEPQFPVDWKGEDFARLAPDMFGPRPRASYFTVYAGPWVEWAQDCRAQDAAGG
jgi:hypothetical protein